MSSTATLPLLTRRPACSTPASLEESGATRERELASVTALWYVTSHRIHAEIARLAGSPRR
jgi:hypothetical protein